ncbi:MAG: hypothetical protein EPN45_16050 [Rhizobiaceae bacterium]|nr:MAG: hypothetical protein EPN45_16050 [Rhizobiaceae bacterium]
MIGIMPIHGTWQEVLAALLACVVAFDARLISIYIRGIIRNKTDRGGRNYGLHEYVGLIHLHSEYSGDAQGSYEELARVASEHKLEFMIITDHNNTKAIKDGKQGIYGKTLVLTGVESSRQEGYLLGLGIGDYQTARADPTEIFLSEVAAQRGFVVMAHARNSHWPWKGQVDARMTGVEIIDFADQIYDASLASKIMAALAFPVNRLYAFLSLYHRPDAVIELWDAISAQRPFVGIFASDIHQNLKIFKRRYKFPKAKDLMPFALNHLICARAPSGDFQTDRETVHTAIRCGHLFMAVDLLGDARGFMFSAQQDSGHGIMGDVLKAGEKTLFSVALPEIESRREIRIHVYRDGKKIITKPARSFEFQGGSSGSYRVEVVVDVPTVWGFGREVTWIFSNPIYLF